MKSMILFMFFVGFVSSIHLTAHQSVEFPFGRVTLRMNLRANNSGFLTRCAGCAPGPQTDPAAVQEVSPFNSVAIWSAQKFDGKVAFKADNGKYLAYCRGCWNNLGYDLGAFVSVVDPKTSPEALWVPEYVGDSKWAFKSEQLGTYLGSCVGCVFGVRDRSYAFIHMNRAQNPPAQWLIRAQ